MGMMGHAGPGGLRLDSPDVRLGAVDPRLYRRLLACVRPYWPRLLAASGLMLAGALSGLAGPYLLKVAIDDMIAHGRLAGLNGVALAYVAASLVQWWAGYGQTYLVSWAGQSIIYDLREQMFARLQVLSLRFYDGMASGRIVARLTADVDAINQLVSSGIVSLFSNLLVLGVIMLTMLQMNWRLALVAFVTIPLLWGVVKYFQGRLRQAFMEVRRRSADVTANIAESISGVRVTQSFVREGVNQEQFDQVNAQHREAQMESIKVFALFFPAIEVISALGTALVLWYGGYLLRLQAAGVTIGEVAAFIAFLSRFFGPVRDLSQVYNVFQAAVVGAERVFEVLDQQPDVTDRPGAVDLPPVAGRVEFRDVVFGYHPGQPVLHGLNLRAEPGQTIALVGPTGAGKTSVINLLARFYDPQQGAIYVDGHDLRDVTLRSWRRQLGMVLQDSFLFTGTVLDNIRYGRPDATAEECVAAARAVGAHEFITRLPEGYGTQVQERGGKLSLGQRQLIAFARALVADPRLLILDEATANIDSYTEAMLQQGLQVLLHGRTALVIAHRLSTVRHADRIYFIDGGRVVEAGTHDDLLARGGRYADLYRSQFQPAAAR